MGSMSELHSNNYIRMARRKVEERREREIVYIVSHNKSEKNNSLEKDA